MNIVELVSEISLKGGAVLLVLMTLVQITPIKINPWSYIVKSVANIINKPVMDKVEVLEQEVKANTRKLDALERSIGEKEAETARIRILRFGDEVTHGGKHSKEHFQQILREIDKYQAYCDSHPNFKNNLTVLTTERILDCYKKREEKNDFL